METYPGDFETFWQAYPRKVAKRMALKSWLRESPDIQEVMKALEWQCKQESWVKDGGKFIPHPTTYLNQGRWEDEQPIQQEKAYPTWY